MLHLYYGRENLDKDRYLFDQVKQQLTLCAKTKEKIFLLVPEQFTLQAERNAFTYLQVPGLMDFDILSQSRLGFKVLGEVGGTQKTPVDKYGRHMLLTKILQEEKEQLVAFRGVSATHSFVEMTNNLISEMKRFNTQPEDLPALIEQTEQQPVLHKKLQDIYKIYRRYEEVIEEKYLDTEDYLDLVIGRIREARFLRGAEIWVTGFDYFPPKSIALLQELLGTVKNVNIVMTGTKKTCRDADIFQLTEQMIWRLQDMAKKNGIACTETEISDAYAIKSGSGEGEKEPALAHVEREIYAFPPHMYRQKGSNNTSEKEPIFPVLTFCQAANFYAEAESAAAAIVSLVQTENYRYRDIVVICNDMEQRASIIGRVFADYGIPAFIDKKRGIMHNPIITFITALLDISAKSWSYQDVFRLLKTDLIPLTREECDELENYIIQYRIRGKAWKVPFHYGKAELGEEKFNRLEDIRQRVYEYIDCFTRRMNKKLPVAETLAILYQYLKEDALLLERVEEMIAELNKSEQYEYAEEIAQIWGVVVNIFDQLTELLGEETLSLHELKDLLVAGFEAVEIGLLPPTVDQVLIGTMQRTRVGANKALLVIGANDGLLPAGGGTEDLLSAEEKVKLWQQGVEICRLNDLRLQEEQLGIYRALAKPTKKLWMSYSVADGEGKELRPSLVFERLRELFPTVEVQKDIINEANPAKLSVTPQSTLRHMTEALVAVRNGSELDETWKAVLKWYEEEDGREQRLLPVKEGLFFTNEQKKINHTFIHQLLGKEQQGELVFSPSGLEKFSRCPYAHFIHYGLRPSELRVFEIAGREIGDVYHEVLMKLSAALTVPGIAITEQQSPWMMLTEEECKEKVNQLVEEEAGNYREGVMQWGKEERYRAERMKEVCGQAAWALVQHVQQGDIKEIYFESRFGRSSGSVFPPIEVKLADESIWIEGKIDRVDILNGDYVKVIDYKSGYEKFDAKEAQAGYKLQLMLYLKAAAGKDTKPAGVFYFEIADPLLDATPLSQQEYAEKLQAEFAKSFKLDGVVLDDFKVIEGIAGEFSGYSDILPVRKTKEGTYVGTTEGKLFSQEEFTEFRQTVDNTIEKICNHLVEGVIHIRPKKTKTESACKFCRYKSICCFDPAFSGCGYEKV